MTSNEFRPAHLYLTLGIAAVAILAVTVSGRVAAVTAGVGLLLLASIRPTRVGAQFAARSTRFDVAVLAALGLGIIVLAATADNI